MGKLTVRPVKWDLFHSSLYPKKRIQVRHMEGQYVSDAIGYNEIFQWHQNRTGKSCEYGPIFISAQTGKGKNHFITHVLREYALDNKEKILYVSNRIALDYQQKKELAKLTHVQLTYEKDDWEVIETFKNVTVLTYHKLFTRLCDHDDSWCSQFTYVVLDECHFFYSDAFFNPHTWDILEMIPTAFEKSIRIYMSATLDDVLEPIRYHEGSATGLCHEIDDKILFYDFTRDYGQYNVFAFSKPEQILTTICNEKNNDKWVIFMPSKAKGQEWKDDLNKNSAQPIASYVDSTSKSKSAPFTEQYTWNLLKTEGMFESKVLITTSVIDNGFSLHDKRIKNIVLYTHDRTEFLQELGRCRLSPGQYINVYFSKLSAQGQNARRKQYEQFENVIYQFCGELCYKNSNATAAETDPIGVTKSLWNVNENICRGFISLNDMKDGTLKPHINQMARWRTIQLKEQIDEYDALAKEFPEDVGRIYKEKWFEGDTHDSKPCSVTDLDLSRKENALKELHALLRETASTGTVLQKDSKEWEKFSIKFQDLYNEAFPNDPARNRGKNRGNWQFTAIGNRLEKLKETFLGVSYSLEEVNTKEARIVEQIE